MKKTLIITLVIVAILTALVTLGIRAITPSLKIVTAVVAKTLCSGVFVSKLPIGLVFQQEVQPLSSFAKHIPFRVDFQENKVTSEILSAKSTAWFHADYGCTVYQGEGQSLGQESHLERQEMMALPQTQMLFPELDKVVDQAFNIHGTRAVLIWKDGHIIAQNYAENISSTTPLKGWSMNKTITGLLIGLLVARGWLDLDEPAPVSNWVSASDRRQNITLRHLMTMTSGLSFKEDYEDIAKSPVIKMLFSESSSADYASSFGYGVEPGSEFYYSSGTSNILAKIAIDTLASKGLHWRSFIQVELFDPLGIDSAYLELDPSGYFVGSSFGYLTAEDWLKLGILMASKGMSFEGEQLVEREWISLMTSDNGPSGNIYGAQYWLYRADGQLPKDFGTMAGHSGQFVMTVPSENLVIVRLGETPNASFEQVAAPLVTQTLAVLSQQ